MSQAESNILQFPAKCVTFITPDDDYDTLEISLDYANRLISDLEDLLRECLDTAPEDVRARAEAILNR